MSWVSHANANAHQLLSSELMDPWQLMAEMMYYGGTSQEFDMLHALTSHSSIALEVIGQSITCRHNRQWCAKHAA